MSASTNDPPEDIAKFFKQLQFYLEKSYSKSDKEVLIKILQGGSCSITKTGEWGKKWGYAEAKINFFIPSDNFAGVNHLAKHNLKEITSKILESINCALEIIEVDFVQKMDFPEPSVEDELIKIIDNSSGGLPSQIPLPEDIISKGKEMSEAYLYIYFVENYLRAFIEHVQKTKNVQFPQEVLKTIAKNKGNESQNKFIPLRGNSDLFYCDFVQLQQVIVHNWDFFKGHFPQQDQHWLRVKIEDMYRVRNLIAHCGYVTTHELQMIKANFRMILSQLKV